MTTPRRQVILAATLVASIVFTIWCWSQLSTAHADAASAADEWTRCQSLAQQLAAIGPAAPIDRTTAGPTAVSHAIDQASKSAHLTPTSIARIAPEQPHRVTGTSLEEQPTRLELRDITLQQLITLLHTASAELPGARVSSLRLTAPSQTHATSRWEVQATISRFADAPPPSRGSRNSGAISQ